MAKKRRVAPPPRPVQAPRTRNQPKPLRRRHWAIGAVVIVALAVVGVFALGKRTGGGASPKATAKAASAMRLAGCRFKTYPNLGQDHISDLRQSVKYNSFPPTSGPHYVRPAPWNIYTDPINQKIAVHNLEHGGIVIQYGAKVASSKLRQLTNFYKQDPDGLLVAPLPALGNKIALTAWRRLALCKSFDQNAYTEFVHAFRFKGPESLPRDALKPGA
jgi:hypothetical protein